MQLTTTWFGTFLHAKNGTIHKHQLFPKNAEQIAKRLNLLQNNTILSEEHDLAQGEKPDVFEERLQPLGIYNSNQKPPIPLEPEDYGFSKALLHQAMHQLVEQQVQHSLSSPDLTLIQMVNALDDLILTANLFSERLHAWSVLPDQATDKKKGFETLSKKVQKQITQLEKQIDEEMQQIAPNISHIAGCHLGARLIALAGGLQQLALLPTSTVQLLGAEKALFRFKKEGGKPPKHGVIFQHAQIHRLPRDQRGRRARILASCISTASKADAFTKRDIREYLEQQLAQRLKSINK